MLCTHGKGSLSSGRGNILKIVPLEDADSWQYIQVLHGPTTGDRYRLGFIEIALIGADGACQRRINIDDVLAPDEVYVPAQTEDIGDQVATPMMEDVYAEP